MIHKIYNHFGQDGLLHIICSSYWDCKGRGLGQNSKERNIRQYFIADAVSIIIGCL